MQLRPYQLDAIKALESAASRSKSALLCLPTGAGKTYTALRFLYDKWLKDKSGTVYWVAHRQELLNQASDTLNSIDSTIPIKWWDATDKPVNLAPGTLLLTMVQSTRTFLTKGVGKRILLIDESHREAAKSYRELEDKLKPDYKFGLTATPYRLDNKILGFDEVAYRTTLLELANGTPQYLAKPIYTRINTDLDFNDLDVNEGGDFTPSSLQELSSTQRVEFVATHYINRKALYGKTLIFWPNVEGSIALVAEINKRAKDWKLPGNIAIHIDADTTRTDRAAALQSIKTSSVEVISNVLLFTEGIDIGSINTIFMCRPTLSDSLWLQCIGRGSRLSPGKTVFNVVDFVDNIDKYRLVAEELAVNLLGATPDPKAQKIKLDIEKTAEILSSAGNAEETEIAKRQLKEAKQFKCDLLGSMEITKNDKKTIYPLFLQDYPYLAAVQAWLTSKIQTRDHKQIFSAIISSYTRVGKKSSFIPARWSKMVWGMVSCLAKGSGLFPNLCRNTDMKVKYYLPKPTTPPDLSLIDLSEPLTKVQIEGWLDTIQKLVEMSNTLLSYKYHSHLNIILRKPASNSHIYHRSNVQKYIRQKSGNKDIYITYE